MTIREFLERSNRTCRRLGREEDGVVLGVMVITLMALFLMGATVYAVGEHIRDRIELQNAADAAAYSAAVVQADTISRIAAINQAMAWTYVQMCRRHMDAILDRWLEYVTTTFRLDEAALRAFYESHFSGCTVCGAWRFKDWGIGYPSQGGGGNKRIEFNDRVLRTINQAEADAGAVSYAALEQQIAQDEQRLQEMAQAEKDLFGALRQRMRDTARSVLRQNGVGEDGDWITVSTAEAGEYFHVYGGNNDPRDGHKSEPEFLRTIHADGDSAFGDGARGDEWFPWYSGQPWRRYTQRSDMLKAEWTGFAEGFASQWFHGGEFGCQQMHGVAWSRITRNRTLRGSDIQGSFRPVMRVEPHRLSCRYFDGDFQSNGGVIVGCLRDLRHPFEWLRALGGAGGFFGAFDEPLLRWSWGTPSRRSMMAVAGARAGVIDVGRSLPGLGGTGLYLSNSDSHEIVWHTDAVTMQEARSWWTTSFAGPSFGWAGMSNQNLRETDWDAVLVPLRRIWSRRVNAWQNRWGAAGAGGYRPGRWESDCGEFVLDYLWFGAVWESASHGGTFGMPAGFNPLRRRRAEDEGGRDPVRTGFGNSRAQIARSLAH